MNEKEGLHSVVDEHMDRVQRGVTDSFDFWLSQHDVSFPQLLEDAIEKAFQGWLDSNIDTIVDMLKKHEVTGDS